MTEIELSDKEIDIIDQAIGNATNKFLEAVRESLIQIPDIDDEKIEHITDVIYCQAFSEILDDRLDGHSMGYRLDYIEQVVRYCLIENLTNFLKRQYHDEND